MISQISILNNLAFQKTAFLKMKKQVKDSGKICKKHSRERTYSQNIHKEHYDSIRKQPNLKNRSKLGNAVCNDAAQTAGKHVNRWITLVTRETGIRTTRCHNTETRMAKVSKIFMPSKSI